MQTGKENKQKNTNVNQKEGGTLRSQHSPGEIPKNEGNDQERRHEKYADFEDIQAVFMAQGDVQTRPNDVSIGAAGQVSFPTLPVTDIGNLDNLESFPQDRSSRGGKDP
jgi:hypothetical protein